ncbi:MAG: branched-chain amino acid ABC transporter substrate-binding protein [Burkholderiaceae bacterium]|jgi:branched-chain amino acid transport system substrate-binding protein|nr:branched-chain amino acid ABC transporter substrate-binding protein [Burkholderiaceae bacterium]
MRRIFIRWSLALLGSLALAGTVHAQGKGAAAAPAAQVVKIAFMDPLSGPFAAVGQNQLKHFQYVAEIANTRQLAGANVRFEIVPFDNKNSPQESLTLLRTIIDQGIRYVAQGNGSHVGIPLSDAVAKHNERNPGQSIVYLNYAAVDPDLTNSKCSFWHFRFDANNDMKMEALTAYMKDRKEIKNVYLINQNYSHGQQVARAAKELIERKRPDVKIVGEDLHPLGQVRDFSPYIAKIRAANADTVITGNWGTDLTLLIRAARDAGLTANFYTYYAGVIGTPTAMGAAGADRVRMVAYWHPNIDKFPGEELYTGFKKKYGEEFYTLASYNAVGMLAEAIKRNNGNADPLRVAHTMSGMKFNGLMGELEMRGADHQLQQPLFVATWTKLGGQVRHDIEKTGFSWKTEMAVPTYVGVQPTSCQMQRPAKP